MRYFNPVLYWEWFRKQSDEVSKEKEGPTSIHFRELFWTLKDVAEAESWKLPVEYSLMIVGDNDSGDKFLEPLYWIFLPNEPIRLYFYRLSGTWAVTVESPNHPIEIDWRRLFDIEEDVRLQFSQKQEWVHGPYCSNHNYFTANLGVSKLHTFLFLLMKAG